MKVLVTGPKGFVGARIMQALPEAIPAPSLRNADEDLIRRLVEEVQPEVIVHTAAMSDIGQCERDPEGSYHANVEIPLWLAKTGVKLVAFSTDQVYSACTDNGPYAEDNVAPANLYARHKLEMEQRMLEISPDAVLLRATWMYDMPLYGVPNRGNFLMNMLTSRELTFSAAQHRGITWVREVAENMVGAMQLPGGVYNYGSENDLTMMDTAQWLKDELNLPVTLTDAGPRHHLWMNCQKAEKAGVHFNTTIDGLKRCIAAYGLKR